MTQVELSTKATDLKREKSFEKEQLLKAKWELFFEKEQLQKIKGVNANLKLVNVELETRVSSINTQVLEV